MEIIDTSKKYIISRNLGGLGNRIKCLVSSMRWANEQSRELLLCWPETLSCNCAFSDLFQNKINQISNEEYEELLAADNDRFSVIAGVDLKVFPGDDLPPFFAIAQPSPAGRNINYEYNRIPEEMRRVFLEYFNQLVPAPAIQREVNAISNKFNQNTVGVHIRSWIQEREKDQVSRKWLFSLNNVYKVLDRMNDKEFFICSDSQAVIEKLAERYGERVFCYTYDDEKRLRKSPNGIKFSLVEMMALSRGNPLVYSRWSTFSEVAWWFGQCRREAIPIPLSHLKWLRQPVRFYFRWRLKRLVKMALWKMNLRAS